VSVKARVRYGERSEEHHEHDSPDIVVAGADAHYRRALAAGAGIVQEIEGQVYGGRSYSCRDPEGYLWNFGTYDPWLREHMTPR
jgi:predicted enzyme related to lactoylglutathione lyase